MNRNSIIALVTTFILVAVGALLQFDLKGAVCQNSPTAAAAPVNAK